MKTLWGHVDHRGDEVYLLDAEARSDSAPVFLIGIVSTDTTPVAVAMGLADLMQLRDKAQEAIDRFIKEA